MRFIKRHVKRLIWPQEMMLLGRKWELRLVVIAATVLILLVQLVMFSIMHSKQWSCKFLTMRNHFLTRQDNDLDDLPWIYVITPTYGRYVQKAELTRLAHTLMLVPNIHWILVEDAEWQTDMVGKLVTRLRNEYDFQAITLLHEPTPAEFKLKSGDPRWKYPKGIWQRNKAIRWMRDNLVFLDRDAVLYFADDDNTYDLEIFNEMRHTRQVSVWPVGLVGGLLVERPIVGSDNQNRVVGFNSMWEKRRPFPIDMAGFAISLRLLMSNPNATFSNREKIGYVETHFLGQFIKSWDDLEPKADKCTKVLVWHTQSKNPALHEEKKLSIPSHDGLEW